MQSLNLSIGLRHPVNLAMLGLITFAGLFSAWWLVIPGVLLWVLMVVNASTSPKLRFEQKAGTRQQLQPRFQRVFNRFDRAQREVFAKIEGSKPPVRRVLTPVQKSLDSLTDEAYEVLKRLSSMQDYFGVKDRSKLKDELDHVKQALPLMTNARLKQEYEMKQVELLDELERLKAVDEYVNRGEAVLDEIADGLDSVIAEVLNLIGREPSYVRERAERLVSRLDSENDRLRAFEQEDVRF